MHLLNSLRNSFYGVISQVLIALLMFFSRKIFVTVLPIEYLGLNGLFSNVISVLSLTELGFGTAAIYALYKPIATNDQEKQAILMRLYAKIYHCMFFVILGLGLIVMPFIPKLIKDFPNLPNIYFIYYLFVINAAVTYLYAYKRSLLFADQKNYRIMKVTVICKIFTTIFQIIVLKVTGNYILFIIVMIFMTFLENMFISKIVDKEYSYIKGYKDSKLDETTKNELIKNTKALLMHKIGSVAVFQTDNLITSTFVGIVATGMLSNYTMLMGQIRMFVGSILDGAKASIGNYNAKESFENKLMIFKKINFINHLINSFCVTGLFTLLNVFIGQIWLKKSSLLFSQGIVCLLCIDFYLRGMRYSYNLVKETSGVYHPDRYKAILEAILNLAISIFLVKIFGVAGVILGTIITTLCIPYVIEVYVTYKYVFNKKPWDYYKMFSKNIISTVVMVLLSYWICQKVMLSNVIFAFILQGFLCCIISLLVNYLFYRNTIEFEYCYSIIKKIMKK